MHILILEDEPPALKKIEALLAQTLDVPFTTSNSRTVEQAMVMLSEGIKFNLILSDIQLLDGTAFEVFQNCEITAPIIFITAYDNHLLEAFKTNGIAYILKPFTADDFEQAIHKYLTLFEPPSYEAAMFKALKKALNQGSITYKRRFAIKKPEGIKLLETQDIALIQAFGDLCKLYDLDGKMHTVSSNIGSLEGVLDPDLFFKINRSQIINQRQLTNILTYSKNRLELRLNGVKDKVLTSSSVTKAFRKWLDG
ncbi:LytTR family DNA-binding domain-containing protein [Flagellimonas sp. DF-77]|uniref:LytR/AlgR family response regulator transcription factor n=1 Tax=Flagellimonas algarum TaxID=3230298 RepID=UPI0033997C4A